MTEEKVKISADEVIDRIDDYRQLGSYLLAAGVVLDTAIDYGGDKAIVKKIKAASKQVNDLLLELNGAILALVVEAGNE